MTDEQIVSTAVAVGGDPEALAAFRRLVARAEAAEAECVAWREYADKPQMDKRWKRVVSLLPSEYEGFQSPYRIGAEAAVARADRLAAAEARADSLAAALRKILDELGVPGEGYPTPVGNAVDIARAALAGEDA